MKKPRALQPGDRVVVMAPASPLAGPSADEELLAGQEELRMLGFEVAFDPSVRARGSYTAGPPEQRAAGLLNAWTDPDVAAVVAARGGYGSVQLLPYLASGDLEGPPKAFIGYSDNTSLLTWLTLHRGIVTFHGPMIERRLARGPVAYDRDTFERCLMRPAPIGRIRHPQLDTIKPGEAAGMLIGGTMTQLAGSLGTPYAFDPPEGCVLFFDEVSERPYRIDRLFTHLDQAGIIGRASAIVFGEMPGCDEPGGDPSVRRVIEQLTERFPGPVLFGLPSGHTAGATLTLPFGLRCRVFGGAEPSILFEEAAVV